MFIANFIIDFKSWQVSKYFKPTENFFSAVVLWLNKSQKIED